MKLPAASCGVFRRRRIKRFRFFVNAKGCRRNEFTILEVEAPFQDLKLPFESAPPVELADKSEFKASF
jgi:hypothetical protein